MSKLTTCTVSAGIERVDAEHHDVKLGAGVGVEVGGPTELAWWQPHV